MSSRPQVSRTPALVEGLDISAYGIARSLGALGVPVYCLNDSLDNGLRFSRYFQKCFLFPNDPGQERAYADDALPDSAVLADLLLRWRSEFEEPPVLFATSDWFVRFLAHRQDVLREAYRFRWIAPDLFESINDKSRMAKFCVRAGVPVPQTHLITPQDDVEQLISSFPIPCLIKPVNRYSAGFPLSSVKVFVAGSREELAGFFREYPAARSGMLMQELISGGDDQVFQCTILAAESGPIAHSTVRKLRQFPPGFGSMCYGRTEETPVVTEQALKLVQSLGYRGLGSLEFKFNQRDGRYYFIEMNSRLPWYNGIFADAGVNLAWLAYSDLTGAPGNSNGKQQRNGITWTGFHKYNDWFRTQRAQKAMSLSGFVRSLAKCDSYAWWNWKDPRPFLATTALTTSRRAGKILRFLKLR